MAQEYRLLQRKFKEAYEASASKPVVYRATLVYGPSQGATFHRSVPFNTWAETDQWNDDQTLRDHYGDDERDSQLDTFFRAVLSVEHFVSAYRPDLSRIPDQATSNEP